MGGIGGVEIESLIRTRPQLSAISAPNRTFLHLSADIHTYPHLSTTGPQLVHTYPHLSTPVRNLSAPVRNLSAHVRNCLQPVCNLSSTCPHLCLIDCTQS